MTGYRVPMDGVKLDSRRYVLATNDAAAMQLVTLEAVSDRLHRTMPAHFGAPYRTNSCGHSSHAGPDTN